MIQARFKKSHIWVKNGEKIKVLSVSPTYPKTALIRHYNSKTGEIREYWADVFGVQKEGFKLTSMKL